MPAKAVAAASLLALGLAQQPGHQKNNQYPPLQVAVDCTVQGGCQKTMQSVVLDSNWDWVHGKNGYQNCYTGNTWDMSFCPNPKTCAQNCALDGGSISDYQNTYGIRTSGDELSLKFVTNGPYSRNIGSRVYLLDQSKTKYQMFKLKNREFTFDIDDSQLECGLNGALYFVQMDEDGGKSKYPGNQAGAAYGTGYCDAQCPHDIKFINGEANILNWTPSPSDPNSGIGKYGTCCTEMDIWEGNKISQAVTPHVCTVDGQTRCGGDTGISCGDNDKNQRYDGVCDKDGCDWNPFRMGDRTFHGPGGNFKIDTSRKFTVVTQFVTDDGTDNGQLSEIRRFYIQDGKQVNLTAWQGHTSLTDKFCNDQKQWTGDKNDFASKGGLAPMGDKMDKGMVLVMSLWDDHDAHMLWLDSDYPTTEPVDKPGIARGTCPTSSGKPNDVENQYPYATVKFSNIRFGEIGSTTKNMKEGPCDAPCRERCQDKHTEGKRACMEVCTTRCGATA